MKRVIKFISICTITIVVVDLLFGIGMKYYVSNYQIPGDYKTFDYMMKSPNEDLYVLGSSVALNGVNASILTDSLGLSCWNGASNGQALAYCEVMTERICKAGKAKYILLGMRPNELGSGLGRIRLLMPYYKTGISTLDTYLDEETKYNKIFLKSSLYRYNTIWFRIFLYNFIEPGEKGERGFIAKPIPSIQPTLHELANKEYHINENGTRRFENIINMCDKAGVKLVVFFPPMYDRYKEGYVNGCKAIEKICEKENVPYYDMSQDETFLNHPEWFYDNVHLNINGAQVFSSQLLQWLQNNHLIEVTRNV